MPVSVGADVGGIVSGILQYKAQQEANQIAWRNLLNQERWNRKILQLQTAPRTDALGNVIEYIQGLGWRARPTPSTKKLMDAEQRELLLSLTEDASRNRDAVRRKDKRSRTAASDWERAYNEYKYRSVPSEASYVAEAMQRALRDRQKGNSEAAAIIARQLMRTGGTPEAIASVYKKTAEGFGDSLSDIMARGRRLGKAEYYSDLAQKEGRLEHGLEFLRSIANDTDQSQLRFTDPAGKLSAQAKAALDELTQAMQSAQGASARAYEFAAKQFGDAPKFSGNVSFSGSGGDKDKATERLRFYGPGASEGSGWEQLITRPYPSNQGTFF